MNVTAGTDSVNKKQTNSSLKRSSSSSILIQNKISKFHNINAREYFLHERPFTDIKIKFNDDIIWCEKSLLAAASPILCDLLLKTNLKDNFLLLNDINLDEFLLILQFIYPIFNPEINQSNISCLLKLSHRFQFNILKQACEYYITKYLNTIQHVYNKYQNIEKEGEYQTNDFIKFRDGTCVRAYDIGLDLCQWIQIYFYQDNMTILESIISILQQISVENLEQIMNSIDINDEIKAYIYKERAEYLEEIHQFT